MTVCTTAEHRKRSTIIQSLRYVKLRAWPHETVQMFVECQSNYSRISIIYMPHDNSSDTSRMAPKWTELNKISSLAQTASNGHEIVFPLLCSPKTDMIKWW